MVYLELEEQKYSENMATTEMMPKIQANNFIGNKIFRSIHLIFLIEV